MNPIIRKLLGWTRNSSRVCSLIAVFVILDAGSIRRTDFPQACAAAAMMSGIRNDSPISTCSPRDAITSPPSPSVFSTSKNGCGIVVDDDRGFASEQLLQHFTDVNVPFSALSLFQIKFQIRIPVETSRRWSMAPCGSGARPRFVCSTTPDALMTRCSEGCSVSLRRRRDFLGDSAGQFSSGCAVSAIAPVRVGYLKKRPLQCCCHERLPENLAKLRKFDRKTSFTGGICRSASIVASLYNPVSMTQEHKKPSAQNSRLFPASVSCSFQGNSRLAISRVDENLP